MHYYTYVHIYIYYIQDGYYDLHRIFDVATKPVEEYAVLVPIVPPGSLRAVLTWRKSPVDLDMWVMRSVCMHICIYVCIYVYVHACIYMNMQYLYL